MQGKSHANVKQAGKVNSARLILVRTIVDKANVKMEYVLVLRDIMEIIVKMKNDSNL